MADVWRVEAPAQASLRDDPDNALLVLRLGIAITALRSSQRLTVAVGKGDDPPDQSARLWAFMLALAYLHEIRVMFSPRWPQIKGLADTGGAPADLAKEVSVILLSGKSKLSEAVSRIRNETVFHFTEDPVREWLKEHQNENGDIVWLRGSGSKNRDIQYHASTDVVSWNILPGVDASTPEGKTLVVELVEQCNDAQEKVARWFDYALTGYLNEHGAKPLAAEAG